jgi:protein O-mannosyl-transferase
MQKVPPISKRMSSRRSKIGVSIFLIALVWIVFGGTLGHDFVNYDDKTYVYGNSLVSAGITPHGLIQAFVDIQTGNWHPLTVISHMLDCQLYGLKAGGHHFTNVLLHTIAVLLLFLVLCDMTGVSRGVAGIGDAGRDQRSQLQRQSGLWRSASVAAVFAIHPLRVESVAWVAERKDVLSAVFFLLTLGAYVRYVRMPSIGRYVTMSILFACGLMSKPMLVTVPIVLLLLDYWPLERSPAFAKGQPAKVGGSPRRIRPSAEQKAEVRHGESVPWRIRSQQIKTRSWSMLVAEKIPLFALSIVSCVVTFLVQERSAGSIAQLPLTLRIENAVVSYVTYIWQMLWPANLAVFYPHPEDQLAIWQVCLAAAFLIAITVLVFALRKTRPYLLIGWLWYLLMLVPVIGIVEVGLQGHADRYTYLPQIGLYLAITWLVADLWVSLRYRTEILIAGAVIVIAALSACAWKQTTYWRNGETLWTRTLAVTKDNDVAHTNFGMLLTDRGQLDDALSHFQSALEIRSSSAHPHYDLSLALIHGDIGNALARKGELDEAIVHLRKAVELQPDYADAHYNLGTALFQKAQLDEAIAQWQIALSIHPNDAGTHTSLGNALVQKGLLRDAIAHYRSALEFSPDSVLPLNNLAWLLSVCPDPSVRNGAEAVQLAQKANQYSQDPIFIRTLAAAYAEAGRFDDAIETAQRASQRARGEGEPGLANRLEEDADLYRRHAPLRDSNLTNAQKNF